MQQVANCPDCQTPLGLPEAAPPIDGTMQAHCFACGSTFPLTIDRLSVLSMARLTPVAQTADESVLAQRQPSLAAAGSDQEEAETIVAPPAKVVEEIATDLSSSFELSVASEEEATEEEPGEPVGGESTIANFLPTEASDTLPTPPTLTELLDRPPVAEEPEPEQHVEATPVEIPSHKVPVAESPIEPNLDTSSARDVIEDASDLVDRLTDEFADVALPVPAPTIEPALTIEPAPTALDFQLDFDKPRRVKAPAEPSAETLLAMSQAAARREQSSWTKPLAVTAAGMFGLVIGYYLLMLIGGPSRDVMKLASMLPPSALPASFNVPESSGSASRGTASQSRQPSSILDAIPDALASAANLTANANEPHSMAPATKRFDPATVPAAFNTLAESAAAPSKPAALWAWMANGQRFGLDALDAATEDAVDASRLLGAHSLADSDHTKTIGLAYAKLCELAQVVSLLDTGETDPSLEQRRLEAERLFRLLFRSTHARGDSRQIASRWIGWQDRPHGGVFFSGTPNGVAEPAGEGLYQYEFELDNGLMTKVVTPQQLNETQAGPEEVLVIGLIVEDPSDQIAGYRGGADRIVWRAAGFALESPDQP